MDLRVWWPQSTATETHGRQAMNKTLAVVVVALGLLGFYATARPSGCSTPSSDLTGKFRPCRRSQGLIT